MPLLSDNPMWEAFGERALTQAVYGGADFGECTGTVARVGDGGADDWHREWVATADRVAAIGDGCARDGHPVSAREAYLRASTYYRTAGFPLFGAPTDERLVASFERETDCFQRGAALLPYTVEALDIDTPEWSLPAYFSRPDGSREPRPTIVQVNGYDSNIQEMFFSHAPAAVARGYNHLCFDGPGQGRNLIRDGLPLRPDWENVVAPVIDYALTRPEIDPERIVLAGWSFGGFLAPRAAAFERRIAALVADPGQWDQRDNVVPALPLSDSDKQRFPDIEREALEPMERWLDEEADPFLRWRLLQRGLWVYGVATLFDSFAAMLDYELSSVASQITCPALLTIAEGDVTAGGAAKLYDAIASETKTLVRFTEAEGAGGHCEAMARLLYHQRMFDWLDDVVGAGTPATAAAA